MDVTLLEFGDGHAARVARPCQFADVAPAVAVLGLRGRRLVLVVVGGASGLEEADKKRLFTLFGDALLPIIMSRQAVVVDGGTDSGVMQLLGWARAEAGASFPLVGVAAEKKVILPGDSAEPGDRAPLERNHSHFVLVPGSSWGAESPWLSWVATEIAGIAPSATILINGGEIAFQDVAHSLEAHRPVLVIAGTGRTADRIAAAVHDHHTDEQAAQLAGSPLVATVPWAEGPAAVRAALEQLTRPEVLPSGPFQIVPYSVLDATKRASWDTGHSGRSGLTDAVDVPTSIVLTAHFTRLDPVCRPEDSTVPLGPFLVQDYEALINGVGQCEHL